MKRSLFLVILFLLFAQIVYAEPIAYDVSPAGSESSYVIEAMGISFLLPADYKVGSAEMSVPNILFVRNEPYNEICLYLREDLASLDEYVDETNRLLNSNLTPVLFNSNGMEAAVFQYHLSYPDGRNTEYITEAAFISEADGLVCYYDKCHSAETSGSYLSNLTPISHESDSQSKSEGIPGICTSNQVNLFTEPTERSRSLGRLKKDDPLTVFETLGEWSRVSCTLGDGYMRTMFIEVDELDTRLLPYLEVGNTIEFGHYEQDNDESNGPEPIEWIILDADGTKSLLLCRTLLDTHSFNDQVSATWGQSTLRTWLNKSFIETAFSEYEQYIIQDESISNGKSQESSEYPHVSAGNTRDKIFLLSYAELMNYLPNEEQRAIQPTPYAIAQGAELDEDGCGIWWLRSPGPNIKNAITVAEHGATSYASIKQENICIRPAMWIDVRFFKH